jgi:signal transduction histidine kinase
LNNLQIVYSFLEILSQKIDDTNLIGILEKSVENSINLIRKMNDLEKLVKEEEQLELVNLKELIEGIVKNYDHFDTVIEFFGEGHVLADQAFYSVIDNLISNAIKHSETEKIEVRINNLDEKINIEICDYGIGIPQEIARKINNKEFSVDRHNINQLGLYIVTKTIERYKGEFEVESNSPKGTIMRIILEDATQQKYH